ncbi:transcriptional regulator NrdR [Endomicrobium proavitum]|uniref:Transcriptional repressor NrdR n=1 Tax=Endomicrobium proavitum TaxID=1408281 RepID=A0A0G3WJI1_9BACT|nr:transcriptional regulator NrdR [Endomicrobium proavitum]AKL98035.1 Transcriptional repressor NrdR [Endomicrobium proavitum]
MKCPFCGSLEDQVLDSRPVEDTSAIRRRRECLECKKRYTTFERPEDVALTVVKSDNRREPFDRQKIWAGVDRACRKRPIAAETIDKMASSIENELMDEYVMEIPSNIIGQKILNKLYDVDLVAYIRFASVYRKFSDIDDFTDELKKLKKEHLKSQKKTAKTKTL